tara:strand:- start:262 stop:459 length:198 start_codon:yes stop_codon:yes gene_type:complete
VVCWTATVEPFPARFAVGNLWAVVLSLPLVMQQAQPIFWVVKGSVMLWSVLNVSLKPWRQMWGTK